LGGIKQGVINSYLVSWQISVELYRVLYFEVTVLNSFSSVFGEFTLISAASPLAPSAESVSKHIRAVRAEAAAVDQFAGECARATEFVLAQVPY